MSPMKWLCDTTPALIERAKNELGETEEVKEKALKEFKQMLSEKADFYPYMDGKFLLMFLRYRKFNIEKSFVALQKYYRLKASYSRIFTNFKPSEMKYILDLGHFTLLEYRDMNDVAIGILRVGQFDIDKITPEEILAAGFIAMEVVQAAEATQIVGYSMIFDFTGFDLRMAKHYSSPKIIYRVIKVIQDCVPARMKAWHIVNEPSYVHILINFAGNFLSKKIKERMHVHGSNLKSLHKYVSPDILPEELGGKQGPLSKYTKEVIKTFLDSEDYITKVNQFGYV